MSDCRRPSFVLHHRGAGTKRRATLRFCKTKWKYEITQSDPMSLTFAKAARHNMRHQKSEHDSKTENTSVTSPGVQTRCDIRGLSNKLWCDFFAPDDISNFHPNTTNISLFSVNAWCFQGTETTVGYSTYSTYVHTYIHTVRGWIFI